MTKITASSKQLEELGTNWLRRLRTDLFFRTEFIVVCIFIFLCVANTLIVVISLKLLHTDIAATVIEIITDAIVLSSLSVIHTATAGDFVLRKIQEISSVNIAFFIVISLAVTVLLGYIAARIALKPTKNGLAAQKQFIGNIAHELRTPLSIIRANSEILLSQKNISKETSELISSNVEELDRISGIINNLLTLNSFRSNKTMEFESVNLSEIVRNSLQKFEKMAADKKITLDATLDNSLEVWGNKSGIAQIVMNLLKNALVYTRPEGSVFVTTKKSSSATTIEIRDTGIGIEPDKINRIFEPFYQAESSRSQNKGSSGLGLAIVSEMVKFHHGKILIRSTPGIGTVIRVDLPSKHSSLLPDTSSKKGTASSDSSILTLDFSKDK